MTQFIKSGARLDLAPSAALDVRPTLPLGTYTVRQDPKTGALYLQEAEPFELAGKIYGNPGARADRILNTFNSRSNSTGVLLSGDKGGGKTLLAKLVSIKAEEQGISTLIINSPFRGDGFNSFLQSIEQPVVIVFDEFEKVYPINDDGENAQSALLTIFDGVYSSKKLFVITANDITKIDTHMLNRPGRLFYRFEYNGLSLEFIKEYCEDNLLNTSHVDRFLAVSSTFGQAFNFDILKAMIEEMNRYGETPEEVLDVLNAKNNNNSTQYNFEIIIDGKRIKKSKLNGHSMGALTVTTNPFSSNALVNVDYYDSKGNLVETCEQGFSLVNYDVIKGIFKFENNKGDRIVLTKRVVAEPTYSY